MTPLVTGFITHNRGIPEPSLTELGSEVLAEDAQTFLCRSPYPGAQLPACGKESHLQTQKKKPYREAPGFHVGFGEFQV